MDYSSNKFKNAVGTHFLKALFLEIATEPSHDFVLYTLKPYDYTYEGKDYPSFRKLYLSLDDPTEYAVATTLFDGWDHYKKVLQCNWFKPVIDELREELQTRIHQNSLNNLRVIANDPTHKAFYLANKLLIDGGYLKQDNRGRPSKAKIKEEADKLFDIQNEIEQDFARLDVKPN